MQVSLAGRGDWAARRQESGTSARPGSDASVRDSGRSASSGDLGANAPLSATFGVTVPSDAAFTRPYFTRRSIQDPRYTVADSSQVDRPAAEPPLTAVAHFEVNGEAVELREPVVRLESNAPYGYEQRVLAVLPAIGVTLSPVQAVVPLGSPDKKVHLRAEVLTDLRVDPPVP